MKRTYWTAENEYWEWEKTGEIYIFGVEDVAAADIETVMNKVREVIIDFGLPLKAKNGNEEKSKDLPHITTLVENCTYDDKLLDPEELERNLLELRKRENKLPYGIIILIDEKYEFKNPPNTEEPAIYGYGSPEGVIILRKQYIKAVKHEFGHMIGLGEHHNDCVMGYNCEYSEFCEKCREEIMNIWECEGLE